MMELPLEARSGSAQWKVSSTEHPTELTGLPWALNWDLPKVYQLDYASLDYASAFPSATATEHMWDTMLVATPSVYYSDSWTVNRMAARMVDQLGRKLETL